MSTAREPTTTVGSEIIDMASINSKTGTFPQVSYTAHDGEDRGKANPINAEEFISALADDQRAAFSGTPDIVAVNMVDGKTGGLTLPAMITSPSYSTGVGFTGRKRHGVHVSAVMIGIRMDIYTGVLDKEWRENSAASATSIAGRLKAIIPDMISEWLASTSDPNELTRETKMSIHRQNIPRMAVLEKMLSDSESTTKIEELGKLSANDQISLNDWIVTVLRSSKQNFMSVIQTLSAAFHLLYQPPSAEYPAGRLVKILDLLTEDPEKLSIMVVSEQMSAGPVRTLPLTKVVITGTSTTEYREGGDMKDGRPTLGSSNVVAYPEGEFEGGSIQSFGMPPYLSSIVKVNANGLNLEPGLTGSNFASNVGAVRRDMNTYITEAIIEVCKYHAKGVYANLALSNAQAQLTTELDVSVRAGRRYEVTATRKDGSDMIFTGVVTNVTHSMKNGQDGAVASSSIRFAYLEAKGFTLPLD